jgi:Uma2 family endonuclease
LTGFHFRTLFIGDFPMSIPAERYATYEDLCRVPDHLVAQIILGQLIVLPRPAPKQALAKSALGGELIGPFYKGRGDGPGGWWILDEPELHLNPHILVSDLAGWRRTRMPTLPETAFFTLPPDWLCEVLSPATAQMDRADKLPIYAANGIGYVWLVDPEKRTLEVFALHEGHWRLESVFKAEEMVSAPPFEAVRFSLGGLWP